MFATELHAMAPSPTAPGQPAPNPLISLMPLVIIFVLFYFLFIRPQSQQQKERAEMVKAIKPGDKVVMVSGVFATVVSVEADDVVKLEIAENVRVKAQRSAVDRVIK